MSKALPDPQIQTIRAARAGAIAFGDAGTLTPPTTVVQANVDVVIAIPISAAAVPTTPALSGTPGESPAIGIVDDTRINVEAAAALSVTAVPTTVALSGTPAESPTIGVGVGTSVA